MVKRCFLSILFFLTVFFAFAQNDSLRWVIAKPGDGIYKLLHDNGYNARAYYHKFVNLNKGKILQEDQLILGEKYYLPPLEKGVEKVRIAVVDTLNSQSNKGKTSNEIANSSLNLKLRIADTIKGTALKGAVFYLISGHGGPDPGATSYVDKNLIAEDEYAYDITLRLAKRLEEQAAKVYMIIDDPDDGIRNDRVLKVDYDEYCYPDLGISRDKTQRLKDRADAVNALYYENKDAKYQRVIEIHLDARDSKQSIDAFFYYCAGSKKGKQLANNMYSVFKKKYAKHQPNRGYNGSVLERNLLVIKRVIPPAAFMEAGNIHNEKDRRRLLVPSNRQALANWLFEALKEDYSNTK